MYEQFDDIFENVCVELDEAWYEVFDGDDFAIVEQRVSAMLGYDCWGDEDFRQWYDEMAQDL